MNLHTKSSFGMAHGKGASGERSERVNLGLALLQRQCKPGVPLTIDDIAAWCDVGHSAIQHIEQTALRKLRKRMIGDPGLREALAHFMPNNPMLKLS